MKNLLNKLKAKPKDFTYSELKTLMGMLGYSEDKKGKTSGSRVSFFDPVTLHIIRLHKPHPGNILKHYQVHLLLDELKKVEKI